MPCADGNAAVEGTGFPTAHFMEERTMKKLFMIAMAAVFSVAVVSAGYAQTSTNTEKKAEEKAEKKADKAEKKAEKKADKAEQKAEKKADKAEKKAEKKMEKKDAANPCAAKAAEKK